MSAPRVTVGMPVYNRAHIVGDSIRHVLAQTFDDFEFLIFDDGSTDGSVDVVRSFSDSRINFLGSRRLGPPHPLNELYARARGEFVIVLHDHDIFDPALLQKSVDVLVRQPSAAFVLQGSATVAEDGVSNLRVWRQDWAELNAGYPAGAAVLRGDRAAGSPFHACSMVRASALDRVGRHYETAYGLYADVDLWFRLLRKFDFCYLGDVLFKFREREKVGHFLDGQSARVRHVLRMIYLKHSLDYFADDPASLSLAIENDRTVYRHGELRAAVRDLLRGGDWRASAHGVAVNPAHNVLVRKIAQLLSGADRGSGTTLK